jgi:hypothetical protein
MDNHEDMKNTKKNVSNQREAHHPSPSGEGFLRFMLYGYEKASLSSW